MSLLFCIEQQLTFSWLLIFQTTCLSILPICQLLLDCCGIERHFSGHWRGISAALLQIECPNGAVALDLETNQAFGGHEREYLLPRGTRMLVKGVQEITDRQVMNEHMSSFYAEGYSALKIYRLQYVGRA